MNLCWAVSTGMATNRSTFPSMDRPSHSAGAATSVCALPAALTPRRAPRASSRQKTSEAKSGLECLIMRLPPTVPTLRTEALATRSRRWEAAWGEKKSQ